MRQLLAATIVLVSLAYTEGAARGADALSPTEVAARVLPAVVSISSLVRERPVATTAVNGSIERSPAPRGKRIFGSGFVIDPAGVIVTNRHVIEGSNGILVTLQDNTLLRATVLAVSDQADIALLAVAPAAPLASVSFGDSDAVRVADPVIAIGNPLSLGGSVTTGIVSALNRDIRDTPFDDYIQTDAAINHGNSGGPLFSLRGEVIGMNTAIFAKDATSGSIGLGFAIPSNDVAFVAAALRRPGGMRTGTLDFRIQQVTPEIADALNMPKAEGVIVGGTTDGGAASQCGIVAGDIIQRFGDLEVKDVRMLARAVARTRPGTQIRLLIWRNEEPMLVTATIQEILLPTAAATMEAPVASDPGWGLAPLDEAARSSLRLDAKATGVVVTALAADGAAAEAGIKVGDVVVQIQQERVVTPADAVRLVERARAEQRRHAVVLVTNAQGLRWLPMSLE